MHGFIANTDRDWFDLLSRRQRSPEPFDEVNFWKPSATVPFKAVQPGEPLLFRLKSPENAIAGAGIVERFSVLPVWLAWETFKEANGVASLSELDARLRRIRARNGMDATGEMRIGCILLSAPVFFERDEWVELPSDWKGNIVTGKTYDLAAGEGARVWRDCQTVLAGRSFLAAERAIQGERFGDAVLVRPRLGQAGFRIAVLEAYGRSCAVTTEHSLPVLEAAHIRPYAGDGTHEVTNGLLLRTDIHRLFDRGYVTVTPDYEFRVSDRLRSDYANGKTYYALQNRRIALPGDLGNAPSRDALAWHAEHCFMG